VEDEDTPSRTTGTTKAGNSKEPCLCRQIAPDFMSQLMLDQCVRRLGPETCLAILMDHAKPYIKQRAEQARKLKRRKGLKVV